MKKILCTILALACILASFYGCSAANEEAEATSSNTTIAEQSQSTSAKPTAKSDTKPDTTSDTSTTKAISKAPVSTTSKAVSGTSTTKKAKNTQKTTTAKSTTQDKYKTDPVPDGKPLPKEPETQKVDTVKSYTCTMSIECSTILDNLNKLDSDKLDIVPKNGVIFASQTVKFYDGESVFDVLQRVCKENKIHMESSFTPMYNSAYIEGIANLYEFDCGSSSGWMYSVNGWYPNYGCSRYTLKQGDRIEWRYTCNLGKDIGK